MFSESTSDERKPGIVIFHPIRSEEYNIPKTFGGQQLPQQLGTRPQYRQFLCGACGSNTNGRVICDLLRENQDPAMHDSWVSWCICSCDRNEPTILIDNGPHEVTQLPVACEFNSEPDWPPELAKLYDEATRAFASRAFTATAMICRKLLMACACEQGAVEGKAFTDYVNYITDNVLSYPAAKESIDRIRNIGNDATHKIEFVNEPDARRAMKIITYLLHTVYSLPSA